MKKFNLIIGKRQIVIVSLLVTLSVAAFLNWQFATGDQAVTVMDISNKTEKDSKENSSGQNYGDAELVTKNETGINKNNSNYIKRAKLDKENAFDEAVENNRKLLQSGNISSEDQTKVINQSLALGEIKKQADTIETQVKSKDYVDGCVCYIENNRVNIWVEIKQELTDNQITQIKNIVQQVTKYPGSNIVITPFIQNSAEKTKSTQNN